MIVFRTDASATTGFGHIKRSSYLASLLKNKTPVLFCVGGDKIAARYLEEKGFSYCRADRWTLSEEPTVKSIVFDLRHFNDRDIQLIGQAKTGPVNTLQITDLGLSQQDVDLTIDASIDPLFPYSPDKKLLHGPGVAILHTKFRHFNKVRRKYRKTVKNVFICFGGAVDYQRLRKAVELLVRHRLNVKIAPGFYLKGSSRKALKRLYPGVRFVGKTESLARSFFEADIALITPGVAAYEAAATGTPALYFYYHDQQKTIARSFEKKDAGLEIANIDDLLQSGNDMIGKINTLTLEKRIHMGHTAKQLVDGKGVYRIIDCFEREGMI
ncbi:MAG: hypothetical protein GY940_39150 [bacterium]|nr:hypothetical protein [bacterium]